MRILVCDDHPLVSAALVRLIELQSDLEVVGLAADGLEAVRLARAIHPDVVVLDLRMPGLSGASALGQIVSDDPEVAVLILTAAVDAADARRLLRDGAAGYVLKTAPTADLVRAIHAVGRGEIYVDASLAARVFAPPAGRKPALLEGRPTPLDEEILRFVAEGLPFKEIAVRMSISVRQLEARRARAMAKTGCATRVDVVRYAVERGWLKG